MNEMPRIRGIREIETPCNDTKFKILEKTAKANHIQYNLMRKLNAQIKERAHTETLINHLKYTLRHSSIMCMQLIKTPLTSSF